MANEKTEQEKAAEKLAADKATAEKLAAEKAPKVAAPEKFTVDADGNIRTGNLTRDSIAMQVRGKLTEEGKSETEATSLAVKRAFEMVKG